MTNSSQQSDYLTDSISSIDKIDYFGGYNSIFAPTGGAGTNTISGGAGIINGSPYEFNVTKGTTLRVNGTIELNGESLNDRLERIETLLQIPSRDAIIEAQYPKLRELFEQYMAELEKYKTWNRLNKGTEK